ncbi:MAG: family 20 glycosylhydrolase [Thermoanaerobaculia bacterium]|nr:family 20 glycosylhydrolase [Thermoanaerobaculia bacterium]
MLRRSITWGAIAVAFWAPPVAGEPERAAGLAHPELALRFELLDNVVGGESRFRAAFTLENRGRTALPAAGWAVYFNFLPVPDRVEAPVVLERVNGDLRRLAPGPGFPPLRPGEELVVVFTAPGALINDSAAPAGPYLVVGEGASDERTASLAGYAVAPLPPERIRRSADDRVPVPTPASRFEANRRLGAAPVAPVPIVPTPVRFRRGPGVLRLTTPVRVARPEALAGEAELAVEALAAWRAGAPRAVPAGETAQIRLRLGPVEVGGSPRRAGDTAYRLEIDPGSGVEIVGTDPAGVFYGVQSLLALLPPGGPAAGEPLQLPEARVEDAPRFAYRGLHLDVARNFQTAETVRRLIDLAAFHKLNRFHFHLTDDEGWRVEVAGLPELVEVGGRRGHTATGLDHLPPSFGSGPDPARGHGSGHYTRAELVEIVRHARRRHVQVVPEIDLPGHARAAIRAMESRAARRIADGRAEEAAAFRLRHPDDRSEYRSVQGWDDNVVDVCLPSTYRFVERVVDELVAVWSEAGGRLETVHVGGDEVPAGVWEGSPACAALVERDPSVGSAADLPAYFLARIGHILKARGLATGGWEEIALESGGHGAGVKRPSGAALARGFRPWVWNNVWGWGAEDLGYRLANAGFEVVLANATNLYFDLAYENHPREPGYAWAGFVDTRKGWGFEPLDIYLDVESDLLGRPLAAETRAGWRRLTPAGRRSVRGIQGQLWGENARGREALEYLAFPKLLGLAERAWAPRPAWSSEPDPEIRGGLRDAAWSDFAQRLGRRELPRLDWLFGGVAYRLPPPGAVVEGGVLRANVAYPGLAIRYAAGGGDPTADSPRYEGPVAVGEGPVRLRVFDSRGRGGRVVEVREAAAPGGAP